MHIESGHENVEPFWEATMKAVIGNTDGTLIAGIQAPVHCSHAKMILRASLTAFFSIIESMRAYVHAWLVMYCCIGTNGNVD